MRTTTSSVLNNATIEQMPKSDWLSTIRRYLLATAVLHFVWEVAHMPLYTLWQTGTRHEIVFAALHCTVGDFLIALTTLTAAVLISGNKQWPEERFVGVFVVTLFTGILYTAFSEWLNSEIRASWEYNEAMPVVPFVGMGLSPLMQWIVVPTVALFFSRGHIRLRRH